MKQLIGFGSISVLVCSLWISCYPVKKTETAAGNTQTTHTTISGDGTKTDELLENILLQNHGLFDCIDFYKKDWNVQVIYTMVDRGANNLPRLTNYYYNVNANRYFYPASTVKMPTAALALQRLNELKNKGIDKNTTMISEAGYSGETAVYNDPTTPDGKPSIANYIRKVFLVSDNDAFNRLYEFLGQEYINDNLHKKGYVDAQVLHRLDIFLSEDENRHTNPIKFLDASGKIIYEQPLQFNQTTFAPRQDSLGKEFYKGGELINAPMNFSKKNRVNLEDLHAILRSLIFPNTVPARQRFNLMPEDYKFILKYMSQFPPESVYPPYDSATYPDAYAKFLLYGGEKGIRPKNLRIFNKEGDAYGQLIDVAYIVDFDKKIEFFLSAAIYCNTDGIINDDKYDFETIGYPFMKKLGKAIYDYEVKRKRNHYPDLSPFKIIYDK
ncbi:MAG: serine hydrolase [Ginsengibacter sp.]